MATLSRALTVAGFSFMIALTSACGGANVPANGPGAGGSGPAEVGKLAPALSIQSLDGKRAVSLTSLSGKIAIVDFWATWCEPCKKSLPKLEEIAKQSGGTVEVVGISVDDTRTDVATFAKTQGVSYPIGWDENRTQSRRWRVQRMPSTFILDGTGTVRFVHEAYKDDADLIAKEVAQLANEASASKAKTDVASAPEAVSAAPPAVAAVVPPVVEETPVEPEPEAAPAPKPKAKPAAGKKSAPKKKKPNAAPGGKANGV
jgi:cytochrome c biogenesis protein CcmG, thiol:disulfide interchange protein DsbE